MAGVSCFGHKQGGGGYDYRWLCLPQMPWSKHRTGPMFLALEEKLPIFLAVVMGLQHCLAMLGGIITPPSLISGDACFPWQYDEELCGARSYMVSASLIASGLLTVVQILRFRIRGTPYYLGTGLLSVMGTSFTFLPIAREIVTSEIRAGNSGADAYGKFLGTVLVGCLAEVLISFIPPRVLTKLFPPLVTGTTVTLIGVSLIATGMKYWGGGVFCAENSLSRGAAFGGPQLCTGNGEVALGFGSWQYFALGSVVLLMLVLLELFGSPFMRNASVVIALFTGYVVAAIARYEDPATGESLRYVTSAKIDSAPWVTFLWVKTFKLGFYAPALVPIIIAFVVSSIESIGDITATAEASRLPVEDEAQSELHSRIQGGLLADGLNSFLAALMTTPPNTTFSQNNGVISLTRCASRVAGYACAAWLVLLGVVGKFGGVIASIPDCVLGGMTFFLFANVAISGLAILSRVRLTRRERFILALALGLGIGIACEPEFAEGGGLSAFYGLNLKFTIGLWPGRAYCDEFPISVEDVPAQCANVTLDGGGEQYSVATGLEGMSEGLCTSLGGDYVPESNVTVEHFDCANMNGFCCTDYDESVKMWRDTVILILKTPYCIGSLVALLLNLIIPVDKGEGEEEEEAEAPKRLPSSDAGEASSAPLPVTMDSAELPAPTADPAAPM